MKKIFCFLVILLLCAAVVIGCGTPATTPAKPAPTTQAPAATTAPPSATTSVKPAPTTAAPAPTAPATPSKPTPQYGGVVRYATPYAVRSVGVPWLTVGPVVVSTQLCFEGLTRQLADGKDIPCLASSWEVDTKAPSITFKLRTGVKFHDGTDFNAQAVKWNFDQRKAYGTSAVATFKSIDVVDDYTVRISLTTWENTLMASFANATSHMISPTAYQKNGEQWTTLHMVGTGPFIQTDFQGDVSLTTVRNPNYWQQGKPYLDKVQMVYVADDMTRVALFKSGSCEVLDNGRNSRLAAEFKAAGYNVVTMPGNGNYALVPDSLNADSPWSNLKVRQAAEYAIDKKAFATAFGMGFANAINQMYPPLAMAYDPSLPGRNYDVAKAKQLLSEAGYPSGFKSKIISAAMGLGQDMQVALQAYLAAVGIQCELDFPQAAAYTVISSGGWKNALLYTPLQLWSNPNTTFNYFFGMTGTSYVSLKRPDGWKAMLDTSKTTAAPDPVLTKKLEAALYNDVTVIPINDSTYPWIIAKNLQDHGHGTQSTVAFWDPQNAWLSK